jgi:hypothetical protein
MKYRKEKKLVEQFIISNEREREGKSNCPVR